MTGFNSLTLALDGWFDKAMGELPDELKARVEKEFFPMPWDNLDAERRRSVALQWDYQRDPATERERAFWFDYYVRMEDLEGQIQQWEAVAAPTAGDLAQKEARLAELRRELARMEQKVRQARGDYFPEPVRLGGEHGDSSAVTDSPARYVAYPKAIKLLADRLGGVTSEELAAWVWVGPNDGGLAAYLNANELDRPPRFHYGSCNPGEFDYLSPLMACWFNEDDIARFMPTDRYITGKTLIERWSQQLGIHAEAFIRAKIAESRLLDAHPICGGTQGTCPDDATWPPLASGLFLLSQVGMIEAEDFAGEQDPPRETAQIPEIGSPEWRRQNAAAAANARHDKPGNSRDKQKRIREIWASGKYSSRDLCAEEEYDALGMSFAAARRALKNTPAPSK